MHYYNRDINGRSLSGVVHKPDMLNISPCFGR